MSVAAESAAAPSSTNVLPPPVAGSTGAVTPEPVRASSPPPDPPVSAPPLPPPSPSSGGGRPAESRGPDSCRIAYPSSSFAVPAPAELLPSLFLRVVHAVDGFSFSFAVFTGSSCKPSSPPTRRRLPPGPMRARAPASFPKPAQFTRSSCGCSRRAPRDTRAGARSSGMGFAVATIADPVAPEWGTSVHEGPRCGLVMPGALRH